MTRPVLTYPSDARRRGFSFTEILFAVMILGIGFIMVAALFPVAIKQTEAALEETSAAAVAKGAASYFARVATSANFPPTNGPGGFGKMVASTGYTGAQTGPSFWQALSGSLINSTDPRYGWVPFYSRGVLPNGQPAPYAQITIVAVQCRNAPTFTAADLSMVGTQPNLQGRPLIATFTAGNPDTITFGGTASSCVAEGTYVIVADDSATGNSAKTPPVSANGFVYRVGAFISGTTWELMPGGDTKNNSIAPTGGSVKVFVVGSGYNNAAGGDSSFAGPAMDVGTFSSFVGIH